MQEIAKEKIKGGRTLRVFVLIAFFIAINVALYFTLSNFADRSPSSFLRYDTDGTVSMAVLSDGTNTVVIDTYGTREVVRQLGGILPYGKRFISLIIITNLDGRSIDGVSHIIRAYDVGAIVLPKQNKINKKVLDLIDDAKSYGIPVLSVKDQALFTFGETSLEHSKFGLKIEFESNISVLINEKIYIAKEVNPSFISKVIKDKASGKIYSYILFSKKEPTLSAKQQKLWQANLPKMAVYGNNKQRNKGLREGRETGEILENKNENNSESKGKNINCKLSVIGMFGFASFGQSGEIESVRCEGG